jgi:hypothetical protein
MRLKLLKLKAKAEMRKRAELLAHAVAAFRSCLEIYTPVAFPFDHERAEKQLNECERLLTQAKAKPQAQYRETRGSQPSPSKHRNFCRLANAVSFRCGGQSMLLLAIEK